MLQSHAIKLVKQSTMNAFQSFSDGRYKLVRPIGMGGFATVYCVFDRQLEVERAIKVLHPHAAMNESVRARVLREARITAKLQHPNVVTVHDSFIERESPCIVMELGCGSLHDWVKHKGPLAQEECIHALSGVIDALQEAHDLGIVHRDIKPQNLLISKNGIIKLADFEIAHNLADSQVYTKTGAVLGSLAYMAPEQRQSSQLADATSDTYAIAATIAYTVTGRSPMDICVEQYRDEIFEALDPRFAALLRKACQFNPEKRFQRIGDFGDALRALQAELPAPSHAITPLDLSSVNADTLATAASEPNPLGAAPERPFPWRSVIASAAGFGVLGLLGGQVFNTASETPIEIHPPLVDDAIAHFTLPVCEEGRIADRFAYPRRETQMPTPREGRGIHAGDLDNDGLVDIAVNHQYDEITRVYYGPGFWTPESNNEVVPFVDIPTGRAAKWIDIIDIDGDGYQDIITSETDRGNILVAWGSDQREQWTVDRFDQAQVPTHLSAVDWDQDGFGDVIVLLQRSNVTLIRRGSPQP